MRDNVSADRADPGVNPLLTAAKHGSDGISGQSAARRDGGSTSSDFFPCLRRLRGQAGIGAADCPQIHSTCSAWRQAASVSASSHPRIVSCGLKVVKLHAICTKNF
jgi:hypothetical protein